MKIIVADDEAISRRMMAKLLEASGYEVLTATNGREAVEKLTSPEGPRLALIDWMMPELDGLGVCRSVRGNREGSYVYIILLTSKQASDDIVTGLEAGADDYLTKPCNPEELKARLRTGIRILDLEEKLLEAREEMRYKATHDSLTSLLNRGTIIELLARELVRTRREDGCTTVLIGDIDHFKKVNDMYGHPVGDEVLREVGRRLLGSVRSYDFVGRYGGEEFLLVLNNCEGNKSLERAEEIRIAIERAPIRTAQGPLSVTMSLGAFASRGQVLENVEEVLCQVDKALYAAKGAGRNCSKMAVD